MIYIFQIKGDQIEITTAVDKIKQKLRFLISEKPLFNVHFGSFPVPPPFQIQY